MLTFAWDGFCLPWALGNKPRQCMMPVTFHNGNVTWQVADEFAYSLPTAYVKAALINFTKVMFTYTERDAKVGGDPDTVQYDMTQMTSKP